LLDILMMHFITDDFRMMSWMNQNVFWVGWWLAGCP